MGSCISSYRAMKKNKKEKSYEFSPSDINEYDPQSTDKFQFQGILSNIKINDINPKLQNKSYSIRFVLHDIFQLICPLSQVKNSKIKWNQNSKFLFSLNAYELRARFLKIQIMNLDKKVVMNININLYRIATGPYHFDFNLIKDKASQGRLIFDFRVTQFAKIKIQCLSNETIFQRQYVGERYSFNLEYYKLESRTSQKDIQKNKKTQSSYIFQVPLIKKQKFRSIQKTDKEPSPTLRQKRTASKLIKQDTNTVVLWNKQANNQMPSLDIKVKISELMSATIGVKIHRNPTNKISRQFGRSTIILSQLFTNKLSRIGKKSKQNKIQKVQEISKNIWSKGIKIGECNLTFLITTFKILKQVHGKTQTQDGIIDMNEFQYYKVERNKFNEQFFNELGEIQKQIIDLNQAKSKKVQNNQEPQSIQGMKKCMQKLKKMLMGTGRSSSSFLSQNKHKLEKQMALVSVLKMLHVIISEQNAEINKICWQNVIFILQRGQIKLRNWQFSEQQKNQIKKKQISNQLKRKIDGGVQFYAVIYQLLKKAIDTTYLALDEQNKSSQIYKAFCYFKVPIFRQKIIQSLQLSTIKQKIADNHMSEFVQNTKPYENKGSYSSLFTIVDQNNKFYKMISNTQKGQQINRDLTNFLDQHEWIDDIALRGDIFYDNTRYVMKEFISVKQLTNSFNYFPGYTVMATSFIQGMKETELIDYSSSLILCLTTIVQNQNLLYSMLKILFRKTNLYNTAQLTKLITILCYFMHNVPKPCYKKLSTFPYKYFIQNLKQILQTQSTMNVGQTLILLYNNYQHFHMAFRYELSMYLLGKMLWRYIYHWSFNIRRVIYHIIILKIAQDTQLLTNTNIEQRLKQFYRILVNGEQLWNNYKIKKLKRIQRKEDSLHMKMRNKLSNNPNRNVHCYKQDQFRFQQIVTDIQLQKSNIMVKNYNEQKIMQQGIDNMSRKHMKTSNQPSQPQQIRYDFTENSQFSSPSPSKTSQINSKITILSPIDSMLQSHKISLFYKKNQSLRLSSKSSSQTKFFRPQQLIISEQIPSLTYSYFQIAAQQFRQILKLVYEYYEKNQKLPFVNLGLMIQVDQKEMMPFQSEFSLLF